MAEPISLASGLLALATFSFKSCIELHRTIESFKTYPKDVRDLKQELESLSGVLTSLTETVAATTDIDLSALKRPLLHCGNVCQKFEEKLQKCSSRSGSNGMSLRGWAQLKYMGDSIDSLRYMLAGYKSTITIALTDANLRKSAITVENLDDYRNMIKDATVDLEARLEVIDEKLESIIEHSTTETDSDDTELQQIREDRLSTQKCLEICAQLSDHISKVPLRAARSSQSPTGFLDSERITNEGLMECRETLNSTTVKLERHMEGIINRLRSTMASGEGAAELAVLQEEWGTARRCIDICSTAGQNISVIDNYSTGDDSIQYLVSTNEKTIHGRNRAFGLRATQVGGHLNNESVQQISRDNSRNRFYNTGDRGTLSRDNSPPVPDDVENGSSKEFGKRHGRGFKLASQSAPDIVISSKDSLQG